MINLKLCPLHVGRNQRFSVRTHSLSVVDFRRVIWIVPNHPQKGVLDKWVSHLQAPTLLQKGYSQLPSGWLTTGIAIPAFQVQIFYQSSFFGCVLWRAYFTLEVTQGQILSQSQTDATRFWWHVYRTVLKKPSICPWVDSRVVKAVLVTDKGGGGPNRRVGSNKVASPSTLVVIKLPHRALSHRKIVSD